MKIPRLVTQVSLLLVLPWLCHGVQAALSTAIQAYEQQEYERALTHLKQLPQSPQANRYRGLARYHLFDYQHALPLLNQAIAANPDDVPVLVALSRIALAQKRWRDAHSSIARLRELGATQQAHMLSGREAVLRDRPRAAVQAYRQAFAGDDQRLRRAAARELVDLYQRLGDPDAAYIISQQALTLADNQFDGYRYRQLQPDAAPRGAPAVFKANLGYRLESDDNPAQVTDQAVPAGGEDAGLRHVISGDVVYQTALSDHFDFFAETHLSQSLHHEGDQQDLNVTHLNAVAGLGGSWGRFGWRLPVEYTHNRFGGDFFNHRVALIPGVYYQPSQQWLFHLYARLQDDDFARPLRVADDRDGQGYRLGLLLNGQPATRFRLRFIVEAGEDDSDGENWQRDVWRAYSYLQYDLTPDWTLGLGVQYRERDYDHVHDVFLVRRDDDLSEGYVSLAWRLNNHWRLRAQATHQQQSSPIEAFDYERTVVSLGVSWEY